MHHTAGHRAARRFAPAVLTPFAAFAATLGAMSVPAAEPAGPPIDFVRDVQPILAANCVECHGPDKQENGFRLDRRSAALRGGTFPVIAPGNSTGSRLYLKLIGNQFGQQMPPEVTLDPTEVDVLRRWIDEGAAWPDSAAGEVPETPVDSGAVALAAALRAGDRARFRRMVAQNPAAANRAGPGGVTPLMAAALQGSLDDVRRLLAAGADPDAATRGGTTALMLAIPDVAKMRLLLDAGADVMARPEDGRTALLIAAGYAGGEAAVRLLLERGADSRTLAANRASALRIAAASGDPALLRVLIDAGADLASDAVPALNGAIAAGCAACVATMLPHVEARQLGGALIAAARWGNTALVAELLARGADINARDGAGRTALMMAAHTDHYAPATVRTLLDHGADAQAMSRAGQTAATLAALRGGEIRRMLDATASRSILAGDARKAEDDHRPEGVRRPARGAVTQAVGAGLALLQRSDESFLRTSGCMSCHSESLTAMTEAAARGRGVVLPLPEVSATRQRRLPQYLESWRESAWHGVGIPGAQDTVGYLMLGAVADGVAPDAATDAMAHYLKGRQMRDGRWRSAANRPPMESSDIAFTAIALRALQVYAPPGSRAVYAESVARGKRWLLAAPAATVEDHAFQLLGAAWTDADRRTRRKLAAPLLAAQSADGGWPPLPLTHETGGGMPSDAYATGQALHALHEAGVLAAEAPAYQRGVRYLLETQFEDGSWHVASRAIPVQAYFESGFPHGPDQWISAAGTNWATLALVHALP